jgi:tRNA A-37 threonylcarbamoyl transferase component Bud32
MKRAFEDWWDCDGEWVEPPNIRRNGESGVKRVIDAELGMLYIKRQVNHLYRSFRHPFGRPTILREQRALQAFAGYGVDVPVLVFCEMRKRGDQWQSVLVTRDLAGYEEMPHWYAHGGRERLGADVHRRMLEKLGRTLAQIHLHRWQHTCLYPKHVFLSSHLAEDGLPHIALIDLEKCRKQPTRGWAAQRDLKKLQRHAHMLSADEWQAVLQGHRAGMSGQ